MLNALILAAALAQTPAPQLWQIQDSHGVVCRSYDPDYLRRWAAWRNAEWSRLEQARPTPPPVQYAPPVNYYRLMWPAALGSCPGGNCPR